MTRCGRQRAVESCGAPGAHVLRNPRCSSPAILSFTLQVSGALRPCCSACVYGVAWPSSQSSLGRARALKPASSPAIAGQGSVALAYPPVSCRTSTSPACAPPPGAQATCTHLADFDVACCAPCRRWPRTSLRPSTGWSPSCAPLCAPLCASTWTPTPRTRTGERPMQAGMSTRACLSCIAPCAGTDETSRQQPLRPCMPITLHSPAMPRRNAAQVGQALLAVLLRPARQRAPARAALLAHRQAEPVCGHGDAHHRRAARALLRHLPVHGVHDWCARACQYGGACLLPGYRDRARCRPNPLRRAGCRDASLLILFCHHS